MNFHQQWEALFKKHLLQKGNTERIAEIFHHLKEVLGGFNLFEKHINRNGSFPQIMGEHKKYLKPPPSNLVKKMWTFFVFNRG